MTHNLKLLATSAQGCWTVCSCGWESLHYREKVAATLAFGEHLNATREA